MEKGWVSHHSHQFTNPPSGGDVHQEYHLHREVGKGSGSKGLKGCLGEGTEDKVKVPRGKCGRHLDQWKSVEKAMKESGSASRERSHPQEEGRH